MRCCVSIILLISLNFASSTSVEEGGGTSWELVNKIEVGSGLLVLKYRSLRTGLTVTLGAADSPIVNAYACLATEAFDNDGLPHTLEHLIFLGSEDYPYKEVLDLMANRCLADRTNAWTDTDHTCYTVYTAGSAGFLNILPVYLDHILHPLLREEDYMTEVHHVSGEGEDAGVVYSEMQGVENDASNLLYFGMVDSLYPGNSSYKVQTGGVLKNLRESTSIEKVRAYHAQFYRAENLHLIVTGGIKPQDIFTALEPVEQKILQKRQQHSTNLEPAQEKTLAKQRKSSLDNETNKKTLESPLEELQIQAGELEDRVEDALEKQKDHVERLLTLELRKDSDSSKRRRRKRDIGRYDKYQYVQDEVYQRPFQTEFLPLKENVDKKIEFPSSDETNGMVSLGWRFPKRLWEDIKRMHALSLLGSYLTSTMASPLMSAFVDSAEPLATDVSMDVSMLGDPAVTVDFDDVPVEKMTQIEDKFKDVLKKILDGGKKEFDLDRMHTLIKRKVLAHSMNVENSPDHLLPTPAIVDMIYGHSNSDLEMFLSEGSQPYADHFMAQTANYWLQLIKETFSDPRVKVLAYPSKDFAERLRTTEEARLKKQREEMGEEKLKQAGDRVRLAVESQKLPPNEVLVKVPVADVGGIVFRRLKSYDLANHGNGGQEEAPGGFDLKSIPFKVHVADMDSQFVRYSLFLDTSSLSLEDRAYLPLLTELWLESPMVVKGGKRLELSDVIRRRSKDVLTMNVYQGYQGGPFAPGSQSQLVMFSLETLSDKYEEGIELLQDTLFHVEFTQERVKTVLATFLNGLPAMKLSGSTVVGALENNIFFNDNNGLHQTSFLRQHKFLKNVNQQLKTNPDEVLMKLKLIVRQIAQPKNAFLYLATDINKLTAKHGSKASKLWSRFFNSRDFDFAPESTLAQRFSTPSEWQFADPNPKVRHAIAGVPGADSCHLRHTIPYSTHDWEDDSVAAVRVMLQYLSDQMYNLIRGPGLTYGVSVSASVTDGRIKAKFSRASQLDRAYEVFREVIQKYSGDEAPWDEVLLDSAKGSQIYSWVGNEETVEDLSEVAVKAILRGAQDTEYNRRFVRKIAAVTMDDVRKAAKEPLNKFLDEKVTQTAIVCGPGEVPNVIEVFKKYQINLENIEDIENSVLSD